jgi:serine protease
MQNRPPTSAVRRREVHALFAFVALATVVACGGGGGGGGGSGGGGAATTGAVDGTIVFPGVAWGMVAEREPNGTPAQAQVLPPLEPDGEIVVAGDGSADGSRTGAVDSTDAFRAVCHVVQDIVVTLNASTDGAAAGDFDLAVLDAGTGFPIGSSATAANPEVVSFAPAADVAVDFVVTCASGAGAYTLTIATSTPPASPARVLSSAVVRAASSDAPSSAAIDYAFSDPDVVPGRVLLRVRGGESRAAAVAARIGGTLLRATSSGTWVVAVSAAAEASGAGPRTPWSGQAPTREPLAWCARLAGLPDVERVEPDAVVRALATTNDPRRAEQWSLDAIGAASAWDVTFGLPAIVVGMLDSGVVSHPDLDLQRVGGYDFISDPAIARDGDGRDPDPTDPGSLDVDDGSSLWHGSHTAGIAVARGNDGVGIVGVAPGCRFMPLRVVGKGGGTSSDLADALRYAAGLTATAHGPALAQPLRVVNMSLGVGQDIAEIRDAVVAAAAAGVLMVASSGNDGGAVLYPAAYPEVIAVGAVDGRLVHASYSAGGPALDLVAPGGQSDRDVQGDGFLDGVLSSVLDSSRSPATPTWRRYVGTSMAAPHVAGAAALLFCVDSTLTAAQARDAILSTCRDLDLPGRDDSTGAGLLQVGEAVRKVLFDRGAPRADAARLALSSTSIRIPGNESVATVNVSNAGGGTLHVSGTAVSTDTGQPWLVAFATGALPGSAADVSQVAAAVDRTGLAPGVYAGTIFVRNGATTLGSVRVVMEVGPFPFLGAPISVVLRLASNGGVVASALAFPETGYRYVFEGVAAGDYVVHAGTDNDRDGFFCEAGDACGDYGGSPPVPFHVADGQRRTAIDVIVTVP